MSTYNLKKIILYLITIHLPFLRTADGQNGGMMNKTLDIYAIWQYSHSKLGAEVYLECGASSYWRRMRYGYSGGDSSLSNNYTTNTTNDVANQMAPLINDTESVWYLPGDHPSDLKEITWPCPHDYDDNALTNENALFSRRLFKSGITRFCIDHSNKNGNYIPGGMRSHRLKIFDLRIEDSGIYTCKVKTSTGDSRQNFSDSNYAKAALNISPYEIGINENMKRRVILASIIAASTALFGLLLFALDKLRYDQATLKSPKAVNFIGDGRKSLCETHPLNGNHVISHHIGIGSSLSKRDAYSVKNIMNDQEIEVDNPTPHSSENIPTTSYHNSGFEMTDSNEQSVISNQ
ncbi:unnamed protein product [Gordionus sp. m RMFG-2023]